MHKNTILFLFGLVLVGGLAWQQIEIRSLRSDLAKLMKEDSASPAPISAPVTPNVPAAVFHSDNGQMRQQLSALEGKVRQLTLELTLASELLMERGNLPLSEAKGAEFKRRFLDTSLSDQERLRALRILRRNEAIDEEVLQAGLTWIQTLIDPQLLRDALEQFIRSKHQSPALRSMALQFVTTHPDEQVRERAAQIVRTFEDSGPEPALWTALASEQSRNVQRELEAALRKIPLNSTRQAELEGRVLNSGASFSERFAAFNILMSAKVASDQAVAAFANEVVAQRNPERMADLFGALDNTGNLAAAPALINGLQADDPMMRARALDALSEMQADPAVVKWLQHTANNDADVRVRAEAIRVLGQAGNKPR